jgi:hypothetical protein
MDQANRMVVFTEDSPTLEEILRNAEWNCLNKQLLAVTKNFRDDGETIQLKTTTWAKHTIIRAPIHI